jgi:hypothetical protein
VGRSLAEPAVFDVFGWLREPISANSATTATTDVMTLWRPAHLSGPRGLAAWSAGAIQSCQPGGGGGQDGSGCQPGGGVHPSGGVGQFGGGLKRAPWSVNGSSPLVRGPHTTPSPVALAVAQALLGPEIWR